MNITTEDLEALREHMADCEAGKAHAVPSDLPPVTLDQMNALAAKIAELRDKEKVASDAKKEVVSELEACENQMTELLLENGMQNYRAPTGLLSLSFRTSVRQPQGMDQVKFYQFLKDSGRFDDMISVNSMKLNSFYKEEFELARERGEEDFSIPGLTEVKINPSLTFKRTK